MKKLKTTIKEFLNEQEDAFELSVKEEQPDLTKHSEIKKLFHSYENPYGRPEYDDEEPTMTSLGGLEESLEMIGNGEITQKDDDRLMYEELFNDDSMILIVHAKFTTSHYGGKKGYVYEIDLYRNNPRTEQIGGGYGASGIMSVKHTNLLGYYNPDDVFTNVQTISKVCHDIKEYAIENL